MTSIEKGGEEDVAVAFKKKKKKKSSSSSIRNNKRKKNEEEEEEEEEVDLLRVNPTMGFGAATPIGSAERLRGVVEAFSRKSIRV